MQHVQTIERRFYHRDMRAVEGLEHPLVIKSVDVTSTCRPNSSNTVRFDYGFGSDKRLYVEVMVYKPRPHIRMTYYCFEVQALINGDRPSKLECLSQVLDVTQAHLVDHITRHALWSN